jgi:hypothetical protein
MESIELVIDSSVQAIELHTPSGRVPAVDMLLVTLLDPATNRTKTRPRLRLPLDMAKALRDQLAATLAHIETPPDPGRTSH